jgi:cytidylate kinase
MAEVPKTQEHLFGGSPEKQTPNPAYCTLRLLRGEIGKNMNQKIITIDGPSGSGKGTIAALVAAHLGWRVLDSGALYRLTGLQARNQNADFHNADVLGEVAENLQVEFEHGKILLEKQDVTDSIRSEKAGNDASRVAAVTQVRAALLGWQQHFATSQGLVADGRDMGTVVFPRAALKVFLTASAEERARRRYKQLKEKGMPVILTSLVEKIRERDERDMNREEAPLRAADDALTIDSSTLTIDEVVEQILAQAHKYCDLTP